MTALPTLGLLSVTDGRLMGDIGDVYRVVSHFIGRDAYTHELPRYGRQIEPVVKEAYPDLSGHDDIPWESVRDKVLVDHGETIEVPDEWAGMFADGKNAVETLSEAIR